MYDMKPHHKAFYDALPNDKKFTKQEAETIAKTIEGLTVGAAYKWMCRKKGTLFEGANNSHALWSKKGFTTRTTKEIEDELKKALEVKYKGKAKGITIYK